MLEFQEGFFEQEIRNGFYIDVTMKTVWAAELEVLQKVAEICDRYGIEWYAAYGTLLGAIRHEGFVPWDDDVDIWVKRRDYNKLMQILPRELPKGYWVRGPLTEAGYEQFHTCVNSGNCVSVDKKWLEQYHGCPFTVGLDIFPLDYLPREKKDQELQEKLVRMAALCAQLSLEMMREEEDPEKPKEIVMDDLWEGLTYLEENCGAKINRQPIEEGKWEKAASEFWKWANYFAMMYEEEESDYLVPYVDYINNSRKKFPREWFAEIYSATFENFMLPIPSGYDRVLQTVYGEYNIIVKKTGQHEYPYYARQLRALREMVQEKEKQAETLGVVTSEAILSLDADKSMPSEWETMVMRAAGERKRIILCANDISVFLRYREKALDKLEEVLGTFESLKDQITLWWRPQKTMAERLEAVSPELAGRYRAILDAYKEAGWGICDETGNIDRAVEQCDAYYGDMNAILQPFQNAEKPIMIAQVEEGDYGINNADRYEENRRYLCFADFVVDEGKIYFSNRTFNALVIADKETGEVEQMVPFEGEPLNARELHLGCIKWNGKIVFLPQGKSAVHVYEMKSGKQRRYELAGEYESLKHVSWEGYLWQDKMYLLPPGGGFGVWSLDEQENLIKESWWEVVAGGKYFVHGRMEESCFYTLEAGTNNLIITNLSDHTIEYYQLPDKKVFRITYDNQFFWYINYNNKDIVKWSPQSGEVRRCSFPVWNDGHSTEVAYGSVYAKAGKVFLTSANRQHIFCLDSEIYALEEVMDVSKLLDCYQDVDKRPLFSQIDKSVVCTFWGVSGMVIIDPETLKAKWNQIRFKTGRLEKSYFQKVLLQSGFLLMEEKGNWSIEEYCEVLVSL